MKGILDAATVAISCPGCRHKTEKTLGWLQANNEMTCPRCDFVFGLADDELQTRIAGADKILGSLHRKIRSFGKKR